MQRLKVVKKSDDFSLGMKVLRISIGGTGDDAYITYRGDLREVQRLLKKVNTAFSAMTKEPPITPDEDHQYA